jgi:hypothetical protein
MKPIEIFISYAREDESYLEMLHTHLRLLKHEGLIATWYDRQILPDMDWTEAIDTHLETASLILPLVSTDFLASGYCYGKEMQRAFQRQKAGVACVIPIIVRSCGWLHTPLRQFPALPRDGKPIKAW